MATSMLAGGAGGWDFYAGQVARQTGGSEAGQNCDALGFEASRCRAHVARLVSKPPRRGFDAGQVVRSGGGFYVG